MQRRTCAAIAIATALAVGTAAGTARAVDASGVLAKNITTAVWSDTTIWTTTPAGYVPDGVGQSAGVIWQIGPNTGTITIDGAVASRTLGKLEIGDTNNTHPFTIAASGGGTLTFDNGLNNAQLNEIAGSKGDFLNSTLPILLNSSLDISNNTGSGPLTVQGTITINTAGAKTISNLGTGAGAVTLSGNIAEGGGGTAAIVQNSGTSALTLSGTNGYSGGTTVSAGSIRFNSAASIGGSGRDVTVSEGTTVIGGYAIDNAFLNRLVETDNAFLIALAANSGNALDFSSAAGATLGGAALGAVGAVTYSGTLTPGGTAYWLGGGGGTLTVSSALTGMDLGVNDTAGGKVILSGTNAHGSTYINAGTLQFNAAEAIGGTDRSVNAFAGTTVAAGYAMDNAFLNRLAESSDAFTVALAANSGNDLDFSSTAGATLPNASLGASGGSYTYSGTLTPNGTTYRLGGGGTLTVSSSTLTGDNSLEVTGPGTVVLSGAGNTFTGATTVNSGTLQIASAGAFNNIPRAVTVNAGATATFSAADAAQAASVTVDAGGTANFTAANAANGGTFALGGTGAVTVANAVSGGSFTINAGGALAAVNVDNAYAGTAIRLDGGTLRFGVSGTTTPRVSGATNILVRADSVLNSYNSSSGRPVTTLQYGTVDFAAADPVAKPNGYLLDVTDTGCASNFQPAKTTTQIFGSTIGNSGWIRVNRNCAESDTHKVELNNTAIRAGKTVTITQAGGGYSLLSGALGVALLGGAEVLGADSFTMLTAPGDGTFTDSSTFDTTGGLWARSGTTTITATLANSKGSIALGNSESAWFSPEDAACVTLTGLTAGNHYTLTLVLANAGDQATVLAQLAKNPAFSNIAAAGGQGISLEFTAPAETSYFAWDNVHSGDWRLGGDLISVGGLPAPGAMIIVR